MWLDQGRKEPEFVQNPRESAEIVAIQALGWLAGNDDLLPVFLAASGGSLDDLAARATESAFLIAVLDFVMNEDAWVIAFCDSCGLDYEAPGRARQMLPGGGRVHWT